jgi:hypothetical protein
MFSLLANIIVVRLADLLQIGERFWELDWQREEAHRVVFFSQKVWFSDQGFTFSAWWYALRHPEPEPLDDCPF